MFRDDEQPEVESMTKDDSGKWLHKQAKMVEERWRTAHGVDDKLRTKHQPKAKKAKRPPLERKEAERREERSHRRAFRVPLLKGR